MQVFVNDLLTHYNENPSGNKVESHAGRDGQNDSATIVAAKSPASPGFKLNPPRWSRGVSNPDPSYPYVSAQIGQWGLDMTTLPLKSPTTKDYMSYCDPVWTSDYTYRRIFDWRETHNYKRPSRFHDALVVSGIISAGEWAAGPVVRAKAVLSSAPSAYRIRQRDGGPRVGSSTALT